MKLDRLITPLAFGAVTAAIIIMPAERSRDFDSVISFLVTFGTSVAIFALLVLGLNVHWGYTGIFNFGVMAFFLVGAFTAAIITKGPADSEFIQYVGGFGDEGSANSGGIVRRDLPFECGGDQDVAVGLQQAVAVFVVARAGETLDAAVLADVGMH